MTDAAQKAASEAWPDDLAPNGAPHPFEFFDRLVWLDGLPLMATIEPYRRELFQTVLWTFRHGRPLYNFALVGRAKKNSKTTDLCLAALYRFLAWPSAAGNDAFILANDENQAGDDLALVKKLIAANPILADAVKVGAKEIERRDGRGVLRILPARDVAGSHGKTYNFIGFDEIHAYRSHDIFEALAPDPTRHDVMTWITSYDSIRNAPGIPLFDFKALGKSGDDPRFHFSWYSGDFCTDPDFADAEPEARANPSMESWGNPGYLAQQRKRLPTHKFRRLHLNLPGAPDGAAYDGDKIIAAIFTGRKRLAPEKGVKYFGFVDMSGGSADDAVLGISHFDAERKIAILDCLVAQTGAPPFNPRLAVKKFVGVCQEYGLSKITGDRYAGETFRADFQEYDVTYDPSELSKSELYDQFEPKLNAGEVELLDDGKLQEQLLTLVIKGSKIDHQSGDHDDYANAAVGALLLATGKSSGFDLSLYLRAFGDEAPVVPSRLSITLGLN
jgi:hypothetical protein